MDVEKKGCFSYETYKEGEDTVLRIDAEECPFFPSIEDNAMCMSLVINKLVEVPGITRVVFSQKRDYEYDYGQVRMLAEIGKLRNQLVKQQALSSISGLSQGPAGARRSYEIRSIIYNKLRNDPVAAYVELRRMHRQGKVELERLNQPDAALSGYAGFLDFLLGSLEKTALVSAAKQHLQEYKEGDRSVYHKIFSPLAKPDFMFTRLMAAFPQDGEEIDSYTVGGSDITIFQVPSTVQPLYHVLPPEFKLSEDKYEVLDRARAIISEHKPTRSEFIDPERVRQVFFNVGSDMIEELSEQRHLKLRNKETEELAEILVRYTIGFGLVEVLLKDERIQDITANSPMGRQPIFIVHQDYDDCMTNIVSTTNDADSWATKLRLMSGRPLDEANPILDTELLIPGARARVAVIGEPLNPNGLAYAFRRHRDKPWTFPLFIKSGMMNPLSAGLLSFLIDGSRTMLVAGTRSAGKTSLLGAVMVEIMRKYRVLTIEDSVSGDSELVIRKNGCYERTSIGEIVNGTIARHGSWYNLTDHEVTGNPENIEVFAMNKEGKIGLSKVSKLIRHRVKKPLYAITTSTGRTIKVTGDHSLFSIGETGQIVEAKVKDLRPGSHIAVPRRIELANKERPEIDMLAKILTLEDSFIFGETVRKFARQYKAVIKKLGNEHDYGKQVIQDWIKKGLLPSRIIKDLLSLGCQLENEELRFKIGRRSFFSLPVRITLDKDFLIFVGLWIADGCYDKTSVIISAVDEEDKAVVHAVGKKFGIPVKRHSDGFSLMLNSKTLKICMRELFELKGDSYTKRLPVWIYQLSKEQVGCVLKGMFSSDGCAAKNGIIIPMASIILLKDLQFLLSAYDIIFRIGKKRKDGTYNAGISSLKSWKNFRDNVGFLQKYKNQKVEILCSKTSTHDTSDIIPLPLETKEDLVDVAPKFSFNDYVTRDNNPGQNKLISMVQTNQLPQELSRNLSILAQSDIFWDEVKEVSLLEHEGLVYDLSVPECESFVCNNIVAHNTLELPVASLKQLGYNIQPMKVASALTKGTTEVSADEGIRATLRMGDSCLIVGEVRSSEAAALYEAMRVGALANVVAGTIHGDSPYGVFDRVVNDLKVPRTSFKATDVIVVANPIRSPDGLHRWRRMTQITEVGKFWENDPLLEKGFRDLMKYESKTDQLEPTVDLLNGESDVLKSIASNEKEWAGSWDAVLGNVLLRTKIKQAIVDAAEKSGQPELLEADFVVQANDYFHRISEGIKNEVGGYDNKRIFFQWNEWLGRAVRRREIEVA